MNKGGSRLGQTRYALNDLSRTARSDSAWQVTVGFPVIFRSYEKRTAPSPTHKQICVTTPADAQAVALCRSCLIYGPDLRLSYPRKQDRRCFYNLTVEEGL